MKQDETKELHIKVEKVFYNQWTRRIIGSPYPLALPYQYHPNMSHVTDKNGDTTGNVLPLPPQIAVGFRGAMINKPL